MNQTPTGTCSVVVERELPFPPEKIWRALTQPHLIEEWLMKNDFKPVVDHRFNLRKDPQPDRSIVVDCQVLAVEPNQTLSYTWSAYGLESVVNGLSPLRPRGPTCAWNSRASGRIKSRPSGAPRAAGGSSLQSWSRPWRDWTEAGRRISSTDSKHPNEVPTT